MERQTEHQILPKEDVTRLAKEKIEELLRMHNLAENVDLIFDLIHECRKSDNGDKIDICVQKVIGELEQKKTDQRKEKPPSKHDVYSKN